MLIIAKAKAGAEFMYKAHSARRVSKASAEKILDVVNGMRWNLEDGEIWHIYEIDEYDIVPYAAAQKQAFTIRNGVVTARCYY